MTTPHTEQPAEGVDDVPDEGEAPSSPDKTGDSIDSGAGPADKDRTESEEETDASERGEDLARHGQGFAT